jgi:hypothetical protein
MLLFPALSQQQLPHDVRFFFPSKIMGAEGAELWASSSLLSAASGYFKALLNSEFAESTPRRAKRSRAGGATPSVPMPDPVEKDFNDSDDETDAFIAATAPLKLDSSSDADDVSYKQIIVTQAAFSTYRAVLIYLSTGFIRFVPLSSSFGKSSISRHDYLQNKFDKYSSHPVSPASAYRLAHLLGLSELEDKCLLAIRHHLTVDGAAEFFFYSDTVALYEDVRKTAIAFIVANWAKVRRSQGWKETNARMVAEDKPGALALLSELMDAQAAAEGQ